MYYIIHQVDSAGFEYVDIRSTRVAVGSDYSVAGHTSKVVACTSYVSQVDAVRVMLTARKDYKKLNLQRDSSFKPRSQLLYLSNNLT